MRHKTTKLDARVTKTPRTKPAEVRLDELMAAAEKLFLAKGVEATTISEIVEEAQVAKGTFYHYFASKNEMLTALGGRYTAQFLERLQDAVDACPANDWRTRLQTWIRVNVEAVETYRTHDIVTPTITTMIVPTRTRTRFLTNCWTSSKTVSRPAPGPRTNQGRGLADLLRRARRHRRHHRGAARRLCRLRAGGRRQLHAHARRARRRRAQGFQAPKAR